MAGDSLDGGPPSPANVPSEEPSSPNLVASEKSSSPNLARTAAALPPWWINSISGSVAGVASGIVTCPLDVIKTKLQAQGSFRQQMATQGQPTNNVVYRGLLGTAKIIIQQDGLLGLYRGFTPMVTGYVPTWAVYMAAYDGSKNLYLPYCDEKWHAHVAAAVTAGACSTTATNPIWVIKTRLMSQISSTAAEGHRTPWHYDGMIDAARQMYRCEGIRAFYSGLAPALLGLSHVAIQFPLYEALKYQFTGVEMGQETENNTANNIGMLSATCVSKVTAIITTYPHEVLRTRLQTQQRGTASSDGMLNKPRYQGILMMCRIIMREEGWRAFYNGLGTNMFRALPAAMTTMWTYETLKSKLISMQKEGENGKTAREKDLEE